jgi:DNA-binding CsgD family transcriptional regulator
MTAKTHSMDLHETQSPKTLTHALNRTSGTEENLSTSGTEEDLLWNTILNCIPIGVLTLAPELYILRCNSFAKTFLHCGDGLHQYNGHLRASSAFHTNMMMKTLKRWTQAMASGRNSMPAVVFQIPRTSSDRELEVVFKTTPFISSGNPRQMAAIAFICDPDRNTSSAKELLASLYRLTPAEAQLSALLMQGKSLHEAAVLLRVKKDTVRKQLQAIFAKTHTSRQGDLVRLFMGGIASLEI